MGCQRFSGLEKQLEQEVRGIKESGHVKTEKGLPRQLVWIPQRKIAVSEFVPDVHPVWIGEGEEIRVLDAMLDRVTELKMIDPERRRENSK